MNFLNRSKKSKRALFVRLRGIGDFILTLPSIKLYKEKYPDCYITYLTSPECAVIGRLVPFINEVVEMKFDHATYGLPTLPICFNYDPYDRIYNLINRVDFCKESETVPRIELFAKLIGVDTKLLNNVFVDIPVTWKNVMLTKLRNYGITENDDFIILQVDSKGNSRSWAKENFEELSIMFNSCGYKVIAVSDVEYKLKDNICNLTGKLDVREFITLISLSELIVAPDTSGLHIAGMLNRKAIGLFGSVNPRLRVAHYRTVFPIIGVADCVPCNDFQLKHCEDKLPCMKSITPEDVYAKFLTIRDKYYV